MGGGEEISLGKGNRAKEIEGGYRRYTGVMWKNAEKRKGKGHSRWLSVKWDPALEGGGLPMEASMHTYHTQYP